MPGDPGSHRAPPGQGSTNSPWGTATVARVSHACARVCARGAAELFCFPPAAREEQAEARKGPHWEKKIPNSVGSTDSRALLHPTQPGTGRVQWVQGETFLPISHSSARLGEKQLRFGAEGFLTRQQRVTGSSYRDSLSLQTGDHGWSPATCAGLYFPGPPHAHPPGSRPSPCARAPKAVGRGRAGGHGR